MSDYETTVRAILQIPFVKDLRKENKSLRKEIKALKNLIYSLPEFRCRCEPVSNTKSIDHNVKIKTEPGLEPTPCDTLTDDDDVVYVEKSRETENIVYVIDEQEVDVQVTRIHTEVQKASDIVVLKVDEEAGEEDASEEEEASEAQASEEEASEAQASEEEEEEEEEAGEEEEEVKAEPEPEEDGEVYEITIAGKAYYTTNGQNGKIYAVDADEEVGDEIGVFVNGKATFHKKK